MILPCDWEVLIPGLCLHTLTGTEIVQGSLDGNFMIEPGTGNILHDRLLAFLPLLHGFIVHLQERVELSQVEVEVLDKVVQIWGLVLHGLPNNLGENSVVPGVDILS